MDDFGEFDGRIASALARIRLGLNALGAAPLDSDGASIAALRGELDEERTVNAQLEERVRLLKDRQETRLAQLEAALEQERARTLRLETEMQAVQQSASDLREMVAALRDAAAAGMAEPELLNRAILAELESVRAARSADRAELDAVIAELEPLVSEGR